MGRRRATLVVAVAWAAVLVAGALAWRVKLDPPCPVSRSPREPLRPAVGYVFTRDDAAFETRAHETAAALRQFTLSTDAWRTAVGPIMDIKGRSVYVGFSERPCRYYADLMAAVPHPELLRVFRSPQSGPQMRRITERIAADSEDLRRAGVEVIGVGPNVWTGRVEITVEHLDLRVQLELQRRYGHRIDVREGRFVLHRRIAKPGADPRRGSARTR